MFRTTVSVIALAAAVSVAASATADTYTPVFAYKPAPGVITPRFPALPCNVDPAIASVTLTKGSTPGSAFISYVIVNRGTSAWSSGANQQLVHLRSVSGVTGAAFERNTPLTGSAAAGATMQRFTSPLIRNAFGTFEFGGVVTVAITYDPDIAIDGNRCNDDANTANNTVHIDNGEILAFMAGSARSRTFVP